METEPTIIPLDVEGNIYALVDARGSMIGTGTQQVCEVLFYIVKRASSDVIRPRPPVLVRRASNIRSAVAL